MILSIVAGCILLLVSVNVLFWDRVRRVREAGDHRISILIPARNEQDNIAGCLEAAVAQNGEVTEILVYDDDSNDGTASIVREFSSRDPRIRLISSQPLPSGWCGKNFACSRLAALARSPWLLFLDADARLQPFGSARLLAEAEARDVTLLSAWPALETRTFPERVLLPMLNFAVFSIFPGPLSVANNHASLGLAHGACLLAHRATYERLGGHSLVRGEIFEDTRLARLWRKRGERSLCLDGQEIVRVRMYRGFDEIWRGFQKNFYPAFARRISFWAYLAFHFSIFLLPFLIGAWTAAGFIVAARLLLALRFGQPLWSAVLHPFAEIVLLALGLSSWRRCSTGRGVVWKDRVYRTTRA